MVKLSSVTFPGSFVVLNYCYNIRSSCLLVFSVEYNRNSRFNVISLIGGIFIVLFPRKLEAEGVGVGAGGFILY
jgi:hypothetical protein